MGDPTPPSEEHWKLARARALLEIDGLPEMHVRMVLKAEISTKFDAAAAEQYQVISIDDAIAQCNGNVREALRRHMVPWFGMAMALENGNIGTPFPDAPPIVQKTWKNYARLRMHDIPTELSIAIEIEKRMSAFEALLHELNKTNPIFTNLENLFKTYVADIQQQRRDIAQRHIVDLEKIRELELSLRGADSYVKDCEKDMATQLRLNEKTVQRSVRLKRVVNGRKAQNDALEERAAAHAQELGKSRKVGRIGWLSAAGAALVAAGLWYFRPVQETYVQPPAVVKSVPVETIEYHHGKAEVVFGDEKFLLPLSTLSNIYVQIKNDEQASGKKLSPAERKAYFDAKADKRYHIDEK